jgi:hypothetical protein
MNKSLWLSSVRMTRTAMSSEERKNKTINKKDFINRPLWGEEQRDGGAYPAGVNYIAKEGRRLAPLPRRLPRQGRPFTPLRAGGRCGGRRRRQRSAPRPPASPA